MNLLLFAPEEIARPLPRSDRRAAHLLDVLRRQPGDVFEAGLINGPRGTGQLVAVEPDSLRLQFTWSTPPPSPKPLALLIGLPRPQTARDVLRDTTTLGATVLHFVVTEKTDANYAQSSLWRDGEWRRHVLAGAEQACTTFVPEVTHGHSLADLLATLPPGGSRLALDPYEASTPLTESSFRHDSACTVLALGPERGWGATDRTALRAAGFTLAHLGARILRTESAVVAALTLAQAGRDWA